MLKALEIKVVGTVFPLQGATVKEVLELCLSFTLKKLVLLSQQFFFLIFDLQQPFSFSNKETDFSFPLQ